METNKKFPQMSFGTTLIFRTTCQYPIIIISSQVLPYASVTMNALINQKSLGTIFLYHAANFKGEKHLSWGEEDFRN